MYKAYTTSQAADHVGLTSPTIRKYLRHLEEHYPYIQRDTESNYRIFNEYDLAIIERMIAYTKRQGWTVKEAAKQAAHDKEKIYESINVKDETEPNTEVDTEDTKLDLAGNDEVIQLLQRLYESNQRLHNDNKVLNERLDVLTDEIKAIRGERDQLLIESNEGEPETNKADIEASHDAADEQAPVKAETADKKDNTTIKAADQQPETLNDYSAVKDQNKKQKAGFFGRLFGRK